MKFNELKPEQLRNGCNLEKAEFKTTAELEPLQGIIGQERADESIRFGLNTKNKGYNIYVSGVSGTGRNSYINYITRKTALT